MPPGRRPLAAMDPPCLVTLPAMYTDLQTGALLEPAELTPKQWTTLARGHSELGRMLLDEFGVRQMFHPHADAHVDDDVRTTRFLELTNPTTVWLCLDTGHIAYAGGDNQAIIARHPDRIGYIHLKSIDPTVLATVRAESMSFAQAVQAGAMVEPNRGEPEMPPLLAELNALGAPLTAIVEHDLYPTPPDVPLPIATRTRQYYGSCGLR